VEVGSRSQALSVAECTGLSRTPALRKAGGVPQSGGTGARYLEVTPGLLPGLKKRERTAAGCSWEILAPLSEYWDSTLPAVGTMPPVLA
jgi:hypothetical protein